MCTDRSRSLSDPWLGASASSLKISPKLLLPQSSQEIAREPRRKRASLSPCNAMASVTRPSLRPPDTAGRTPSAVRAVVRAAPRQQRGVGLHPPLGLGKSQEGKAGEGRLSKGRIGGLRPHHHRGETHWAWCAAYPTQQQSRDMRDYFQRGSRLCRRGNDRPESINGWIRWSAGVNGAQ